ncbi:MAG: SusD/RagB family nutrient-binding outer membrane lipoprotein [Muribaculaceae bacterium]|nr:SusD/RagB family nutrient-binding outer membrane lipoprotein [Muribaculaceae bacterium]
MKLVKYIALSSVLALSLTSCNDWLDVNVDPDQPTAESIVIENRLPWIEKQFTYAYGCANTRTFATCGGFYSNNANMYNASITWQCTDGLTTTPYQTFFVGAGNNIPYLYDRAESEGAYHYMAAAEVMHALGFIMLTDLYGEIPYTEAIGSDPVPPYDNGKTVWEGCLAKIDHAIELFQKEQAPGVTPLASGDIWNGGDVNKWIKLCYGLKARWLLRVTKNSSYYDPDAILAALENAPKSNDDNTYQACFDVKGDKTDFLLGDPVQTNGNWDTAAYGKTQWASKFYIDMLTNMRGAGIEDPRVDRLVPSSMTNITLDESGRVKTYSWRRAIGVDMFGDAERLVAGGGNNIAVQTFANAQKVISYEIKDADKRAAFIEGFKAHNYKASSTATFSAEDGVKEIKDREYYEYTNKDSKYVAIAYPKGVWYVNSSNYVYAGDTAYVNMNAGSQNTNNGTWDMPVLDNYYHSNDKYGAVAGVVSGTGAFQTYANSDFDILTYYEMCFIKAEVLMRKGDAAGALAAYKAGIKAHMDRMQSKLKSWASAGYENPSMQPMDDAKIAEYLASKAVCQNAGELTMSDIMLQKYIAMGFSMENWVDMRRFNYSAGNIGSFGVVYPGIGRTKLFTGGAVCTGTSPDDVTYWIRRWRGGSQEVKFNTKNLEASNKFALKDNIWSIPVWWDCTTDAEYEAFLH